MLVLPVPPAETQVRVWTVTDLYYLWAKPEELVGDDARVCETCNGQLTSHVQQRRVSSRPNVLVVQVRRTVAGSSDVLRHPVRVEEELSLPDVGTFELAGVVYHSGQTFGSGHYTCASRGPDRQFWRYDDEVSRPTAVDIGRLLPRSVYVLVYTRPAGVTVFAGAGEVPGAGSGATEERRAGALGTAVSAAVVANKTEVVVSSVASEVRSAAVAESPAKRRRVSPKTSAEETQDEVAGISADGERPARASTPDGTAAGAPSVDVSGGHHAGSDVAAREEHAAAAEARALASQGRGIGNLERLR